MPVLRTIDNWHKDHNGDLSSDDFMNLFWAHNEVPKDSVDRIKDMINNIVNKDPLETTDELLNKFRRRKLAEQLSVTSWEHVEGRKSFADVQLLAQKIVEPDPVAVGDLDFVTEDIDLLLASAYGDDGLNWRLDELNRSLGPLRKGDFGYVMARPETGKTTMLASEATYMAEQLADNDDPIIWFNNEEQGEKVKIRQIQACLGWTMQQILQNPQKAIGEFKERTRGKLLLVDNGALSRSVIERYVDKYGASLILVDQLDKLYGWKSERHDLLLGQIYQWARELAKRVGPVIGVCQANGTAEGGEWLDMGSGAGSQTSKPAEADWIVGIGRSNKDGLDHYRYLSIPKNKLIGGKNTVPELRHGKFTVQILPQIARYKSGEF